MLRRTLLIACLIGGCAGAAPAQWGLPKNLPPAEYGTVLISRTVEQNKVKPVVFSHAAHRSRHTCRVCHFELEFNLRTNATVITEAASRAGRFCGAPGCHDGKAAFGHDPQGCERCHAGTRAADRKTASVLAPLPKDRFGNGVDWVLALDRGLIRPAAHLTLPQADLSFDPAAATGPRLLSGDSSGRRIRDVTQV